MAGEALELVKGLYGFDWIGLSSRDAGFEGLERAMDPEFRAKVSPALGERELRGMDGVANFIDALEEDFDEFRYVGEEFAETGEDKIVVSGRIMARGRASKMPLASEFGHVWSLRDGKVLRVDAFLDRASAERAAGM